MCVYVYVYAYMYMYMYIHMVFLISEKNQVGLHHYDSDFHVYLNPRWAHAT